MADPDRASEAIVVGEYERAFYANQFSLMAPLFEHYGVQLWLPEAGGGSISSPKAMSPERHGNPLPVGGGPAAQCASVCRAVDADHGPRDPGQFPLYRP
ncbi:hypothetical protein ACI2LC_10985 [Nonomuraea wenchangensis]|uniref:hypothetical protein n=1 Tax=Nonomuraea wenchangensis TaxID=568860 RepID=UPI0037A0FA32